MATSVSNRPFEEIQNPPHQGFFTLMPILGAWRVRISNHLMKNCSISKSDKKRMVGFTSGEHLGVQEQIERRARELWCAGGFRHGALNDWLRAEREVLEQFIRVCVRRHSLPQSSVGVARSKPETRILKPGRTVTVSHLQSTSALATFH
jgi:DUF2934 family protein